MNVLYLSEQPVSIEKYDVCGIHQNYCERNLVTHLGLSGSDNINKIVSDNLNLFHMKPPYAHDAPLKNAVTFFVEASKYLTDAQKKNLDRFLITCKQELAESSINSAHYIIYPCFIVEDVPIKTRRYSCAGFVIQAFKKMDFELIDLNDSSIPRYDLNGIIQRHPAGPLLRRNSSISNQYGLAPEGSSWPIIFPGYVVRAVLHWILQKQAGDMSCELYHPQSGDEYLP